MMTGEELAVLRRRYGANAVQACPLCGKPMQFRTLYPNDEPAFICIRSEAQKFSAEWWDHVERSKMGHGAPKDPLVLKLVEAYERMDDGQDAVQR